MNKLGWRIATAAASLAVAGGTLLAASCAIRPAHSGAAGHRLDLPT